jgi:ectoine hydroxylase-related dioxygenase (phytanoyl-CoA dioxygenase family)
VGFFLTDVMSPDRGGPVCVPGSHLGGELDLSTDPEADIPEAKAILAPAGTAMIIDPRIWHAVGANRSPVTRKMLYFAYAYRWIRPVEPIDLSEERLNPLSPVHRQLLGAGSSGYHFHYPEESDVPLRDALLKALLH